jgi:undecaprenyl-phosphate 4-deoxy-4-formamido-L-arabinose transferase
MERLDELEGSARSRNGRVVPELSVVVTLDNEAVSLEEFYRRAVLVLEPLGMPFELIFVDDGSLDGTFALLERLHAADGRVRVLRLKRNFGQHAAMHAGLTRAAGSVVVTMGGDLQNPPEDIPRLVAALECGFDVASGLSASRSEPWRREFASRLINSLLRRLTGVAISDFGCAFNAYRREAFVPLLGAIGKQQFTKALVLSSGASVVEIDVGDRPPDGAWRSSPLSLIRIALHVVVALWPRPIQVIGIGLGLLCTLAATAVGVYGIAFWVVESDFPGPLLAGGALLAILGVQGFILALIGEYLARIQRDVEGIPLYTIDTELG